MRPGTRWHRGERERETWYTPSIIHTLRGLNFAYVAEIGDPPQATHLVFTSKRFMTPTLGVLLIVY